MWPIVACLGASPEAGGCGGGAQAPASTDEAATPQGTPGSTPDDPDPPGPSPDDAFAREHLESISPERRVGWPTESAHLTSHFGWRVDPVSGRGTRLHRGVDLRGHPGDLVMSIAPGRVEFSGQDVLLGNMVVVDHGLGIRSFYGHLTDVLVHEGLTVEQGTAIGLVGNTGRSAAPHLHLSVQVHGVAVDPLALIGQPLHAPAALANSLDEREDPIQTD